MLVQFLNKFSRKPRITILVDRPNWAYDIAIREVCNRIGSIIDTTIKYVVDAPYLDSEDFDMLHVCFWGERYYKKFNIPRNKIIKEVSSHRWQFDDRYGKLSAKDFVNTYLSDAEYVCCSSERLFDLISNVRNNTSIIKNGINTSLFFYNKNIACNGDIRIAWAGNAKDPVKGLDDIIIPAANSFDLYLATGNIPHENMPNFYQNKDVYVVASKHEAEPLPLLESMACGCFPICTDVGIVSEIVQHKVTGYIVRERSIESFREAFQWCSDNIQYIRATKQSRSEYIHSLRDWNICSKTYLSVWANALRKTYFPIFRNDDVSPDTDIVKFKKFCDFFHKEYFTQIHAVTLSGCCNVCHRYGGVPCEYKNLPPISLLQNEVIYNLSKNLQMEDQYELINFLNNIPDELAFHGTAHVDFSKMPDDLQRYEFSEGLRRMKLMFPEKKIRYFVPPFNRVSPSTARIAKEFDLSVLGTDGVHLEESINTIDIFDARQYRFHHHRFYSETCFDYYNLDFDKIKKCLSKSICFKRKDIQRENKFYLLKRQLEKIKNIFNSKNGKNNLFPISIKKIEDIVRYVGAPEWHCYAFRTITERRFTYETLLWIKENISYSARIMEVGCGCGINLFILSSWGFRKLSGIELDEKSNYVAQLLAKRMSYDIKFGQGNLFEFLSSVEYDVILAINCLYYDVDNDLDRFLEIWSKSIRKGGYIIFDVIDIAYNSITNNDICTQDWGKDNKNMRPLEYVRRYSKTEIFEIADRYGLDIYLHKFYTDTPQRSIYILKK